MPSPTEVVGKQRTKDQGASPYSWPIAGEALRKTSFAAVLTKLLGMEEDVHFKGTQNSKQETRFSSLVVAFDFNHGPWPLGRGSVTAIANGRRTCTLERRKHVQKMIWHDSIVRQIVLYAATNVQKFVQ